MESLAEKAQVTTSAVSEWFAAYRVKDYRRAITLIEDQIKGLAEGDDIWMDFETWRGYIVITSFFGD
jgi:hypothetical protein